MKNSQGYVQKSATLLLIANYRLPGGGVRVEVEVGSPHPLLASQNLEYRNF